MKKTHHEVLLLDGPKAGETITVPTDKWYYKVVVAPPFDALVGWFTEAAQIESPKYPQYIYAIHCWHVQEWVYKVACCSQSIDSFDNLDVCTAIEAVDLMPCHSLLDDGH